MLDTQTAQSPQSGLPPDVQATLGDPDFQLQTWQRRAERSEAEADRLRAQLTLIYGADALDDWRSEGLPLPPVAASVPGTIVFEASVAAVNIKRTKNQGAQLVVTLTSPMAGSPVRELAGLAEDNACLIRVSPVAAQLAFTELQNERLANQPIDDFEDIAADDDDDDDGEGPVGGGAGGDEDGRAGSGFPPSAPSRRRERDPRRRSPVGNRRVNPR